MASPSGTSSGSSLLLRNSGSEEDLQGVMDQKKRKRMISNREAARRSRMRKQKHLEDLMATVSQLRKESSQVSTVLGLTARHYSAVEAENCVLRAQVMELSSRLQSLNELFEVLQHGNNSSSSSWFLCDGPQVIDGLFSPWRFGCMNQPIMASAESMFNCCL